MRALKTETSYELHRELVNAFVVPSCLNCMFFSAKTEQCGEFKMRPPVQVLVFSCKTNWMEDIPF